MENKTRNFEEEGREAMKIRLSDLLVPFRCVNYVERIFDNIENDKIPKYIMKKYTPRDQIEFTIFAGLVSLSRIATVSLINLGVTRAYVYLARKGIERLFQ